MKTSKDNLLMSTLIAAMVTFASAGVIDSAIGTTESDSTVAPTGAQAAVRPTTTDVPSVVVVAPRITRLS